jgi:phosphopantetheinyl transferase
VSHSGGRVAAAICEDGEVGLDLEEMPAGNDARGAASFSLAKWTATEAALKSVGAGLRTAREIRLSEDRSFAMLAGAVIHLRPIEIAPGCVGCLATPAVVTVLRIEEVRVRWPPAFAGAAD